MRRVGDRGFTLVELLAVLAILALLIGLVAPNLSRGLERERVRASLRSFSAVLRLARSTAVTDRKRVRVLVDLDGGRWWLEGSGRQGGFPAGLRITQAALVWQDRTKRRGYLVFYADGSSSGGHLELLGPGPRRYFLKVDIITSRVDVEISG